jgi:beta-galactosidase
MQKTFEIRKDRFYLDGHPFHIHAGEMHPSRIPREYWEHRIKMAAAMGLNTISIYSFWNIHEPKPNEFNFKGWADVAEFIRLVQKEGLYAIVRPGPYCCAEWDLGGFPAWLLKSKTIRFRCNDPEYLEYATRYLKHYLSELVSLQIDRGGPILMFQLENEYGSYGRDKAYLKALKSVYDSVGITVPLFTSDGGSRYYLVGGTLPDVLPVVNFGSNPQGHFKALSEFRADIPHMCGEFYPGWFNHWGDLRLVKPRTMLTVNAVKWMIENNKSFNLYVVHGGTNFGWTAGANLFETYKPTITSYDYGAPVDESGLPNSTFHELRNLLIKKRVEEGKEVNAVPTPIPRIKETAILLEQTASIFSKLPEPIKDILPESMEHYGQNYGYIMYRTILDKSYTGTSCKITEIHDIGHVYLDGKKIAELNRIKKKNSFRIPRIERETAVLDILVEALGRVNYGFGIQTDRKGIIGQVVLNRVHVLMNWEIVLFPFDSAHLDSILFGGSDSMLSTSEQMLFPRLFRGSFHVEEIGDGFLDMRPFKRGMVWINGNNLGRYWEIGPQKSLYVPGAWLKKGENQIVILETVGFAKPTLIRKGLKLAQKKAKIDTKKGMYLILRPNRVQ